MQVVQVRIGQTPDDAAVDMRRLLLTEAAVAGVYVVLTMVVACAGSTTMLGTDVPPPLSPAVAAAALADHPRRPPPPPPCEFGAVCENGGRCVLADGSNRTICVTEAKPSELVFDVPFATDAFVMCSQGNRNYEGTHSNAACIHALDLYTDPGPSVVRAAADGVVVGTKTDCPGYGLEVHQDWCNKGLGNAVHVQHADGSLTRYGHLQRVGVVVGDKVKHGDPLGLEGATGNAHRRHLHFSVHRAESGGQPGTSLPFRLRVRADDGGTREVWSNDLPCNLGRVRVR